MEFVFEKNAAQFIRERGAAVVIAAQLEPSIGGCPCAKNNLTGSNIPSISLCRPSPDEIQHYQREVVEGVEVYFSPNMTAKPERNEIKIRMRGTLWFRWLELEGARATACYTTHAD